MATTTPQRISGTTDVYGIMGHPVTHSLSPVMQTCAFRHHGLDAVYVPFPVAPERLDAAVAGAVALGVRGFNVTLPHKEKILSFLDEVAPEARFIGAVNTVHIHEGQTHGYNTDSAGFLEPLQRLSLPFARSSACILGAGGAARAITMALLQAGCPALVVANRTVDRARQLVTELRTHFPRAELEAVPLEQAARFAGPCALIVNATSVGLHATTSELLSPACFRPGQVVYDIVYRPLETPLLQAARQRGATIVPGIEMLIGQGAEAFRLWTGRPFPLTAVRQVLQPFLAAD